MIQSNTMRFATDDFAFTKKAFLQSRVALDTTSQSTVDGFTIEGVEPGGSLRRILFKVNDTLWKFDGQNPVEVGGGEDYDNVIEHGNTVAEVTAVTSIPAWVGAKIYPLIALYSPADAAVMPTIKMGLKVASSGDVYEEVAESAEIDLTSGGEGLPRISDIEIDSVVTGDASINITARVENDDGWSEYMAVQSVKDVDARAIQFRIRYTVTTIGGADTAKVNKIVVRHTTGTATVSGDTAEIYSIQKDMGDVLKTCAVSVRHKYLSDSIIKAYVNFVQPMKQRTFLPIGVSNGTSQTLVLGVDGERDSGIDQSTLQLYVDGNPLSSFSYNTQVSEVTVNVAAGKAITATYQYGRGFETWREMTLDIDQQPYEDGSRLSRFIYSLPEDDVDGQTVTNIRLVLRRTTGHVDNEVLGTANGTTQQFVLSHAAKADTLTVNAAFSYDEDSQVVTLIAPVGTELLASYDWTGESHTIYSWSAAWSPAA